MQKEFRAQNYELVTHAISLLNEILYFEHEELSNELSQFSLGSILNDCWNQSTATSITILITNILCCQKFETKFRSFRSQLVEP